MAGPRREPASRFFFTAPSGDHALPRERPTSIDYLGSLPGFGSSIGNDCAPVGGAVRNGAGASLWTPLAAGGAGAGGVVVCAGVGAPVPEFTAVMNRRAESSLLFTLPETMSEARTS